MDQLGDEGRSRGEVQDLDPARLECWGLYPQRADRFG
jgi:hypothetical protein